MSGGSYEYLYGASAFELGSREEMLEEMRDRLAGLGYAEDAARETAELLATMRQFHIYADVAIQRLAGVWQAVEWWDSMDWSENDVRGALAEYRTPKRRHGAST